MFRPCLENLCLLVGKKYTRWTYDTVLDLCLLRSDKIFTHTVYSLGLIYKKIQMHLKGRYKETHLGVKTKYMQLQTECLYYHLKIRLHFILQDNISFWHETSKL